MAKLHPTPQQLREKGIEVCFYTHHRGRPDTEDYRKMLEQADKIRGHIVELDVFTASDGCYAVGPNVFFDWLEKTHPSECAYELFIDTSILLNEDEEGEKIEPEASDCLVEEIEHYFWNKELWIVFKNWKDEESTMTFNHWLEKYHSFIIE